jgi:IS5 family transposase
MRRAAGTATTLKHCKGGQFAIHAQALPGNPYDGHTLARIIPAIEQLVGNTTERLHADAGYRGHNAPPDYWSKVYISKQKRRLTPRIEREMRRRSAIEPVIGPPQERAPHGPQLPPPSPRRRQQCHPGSRRLQLPAPHQVAKDFIGSHPGRDLGAATIGHSMKDDL